MPGALGSINTRQPDLVLNLAGIQDHDGITVRDTHNAACEGFGGYRVGNRNTSMVRMASFVMLIESYIIR